MQIAVLGCGPAGLIAADTAWMKEHDVDVFSRKVKSEIAGAQFMHAKIGWYCSATHDLEVSVIKAGTARGYAVNVYGDPEAKTSWNKFTSGIMFGWDMKASYDRLWGRWENRIDDVEVSHDFIMRLLANYDKVISSIPLQMLCYDSEHTFKSQLVHIIHGPAQDAIEGVNDNDIMYYNGDRDSLGVLKTGLIGPPWYRFSQLSKYQSWEYADHRSSFELLAENIAPWQSIMSVKKPVSTNCDCYGDIIKVGRYGCYDKSILTHHVKEIVLNAVQ